MYNLQNFHKACTFLALQESGATADSIFIPDLHWRLLDHYRSSNRLVAVVCPVGFAKSTTLKNFGLYELLNNEKFIIYCTSTHSKAKAQMTSISFILRKEATQQIFDYKIITDNETEIVINIKGVNKKLLALSYGTDISGINFEGVRPTLILIDDIEELSTANSQDLTNKLLSWINATLISRLPSLAAGRVRLIGTNLSKTSIINQLIEKKITGWTTYKYTCYNPDTGDSWWENQHPTEYLRKEEISNPTIFAMNYLNAPLDLSNSRIKADNLRFYQVLPEIVESAMHYDLTHTAKTTSDYSCVCLVGKGVDNNYYVIDWYLSKSLDPAQQAQQAIFMYQKHKNKNIRQFTYDAIGNDGFGLWARKLALEQDISLPLEGVKYSSDKNTHLTEHEPHFTACRIYLNSQNPQLDLATTQLTGFPSASHDDFLDGLLGCLDYWKNPVFVPMEEADLITLFTKKI